MSEHINEKREQQRDKVKDNLFFVLELAIVVLVALLIRRYVFTLTIVSGSSMEETLHDHEIVAVSKLHYSLNAPQRGDVVICNYPDSTKNFVKRIVAIEGDTIEIRDGSTYINGQALQEEFIVHRPIYDFGPTTIAAGQIFVMGDNRSNSHDSRAEGPLSIDMLEGRVFAVVFPFNEMKWMGFSSVYAKEGLDQ